MCEYTMPGFVNGVKFSFKFRISAYNDNQSRSIILHIGNTVMVLLPCDFNMATLSRLLEFP